MVSRHPARVLMPYQSKADAFFGSQQVYSSAVRMTLIPFLASSRTKSPNVLRNSCLNSRIELAHSCKYFLGKSVSEEFGNFFSRASVAIAYSELCKEKFCLDGDDETAMEGMMVSAIAIKVIH